MNDAEEIRCWATSADKSLDASLLLGRTSARAIAKAHLSELFRLVDGDRDAARTEVSNVQGFGSRRLLLECFRLTFSLMSEDPKFHILLSSADLSQKPIAAQYDRALLALLRECDGKKEAMANKVRHFPVKNKKILLERLEHPDFKLSRKVKLNRNMLYGLSNNLSEKGPLTWWQWVLVFFTICGCTIMFVD